VNLRRNDRLNQVGTINPQSPLPQKPSREPHLFEEKKNKFSVGGMGGSKRAAQCSLKEGGGETITLKERGKESSIGGRLNILPPARVY